MPARVGMDAVDRFFREHDLEDIRAAVAEAELKTSGEIVPYVVSASDAYPSAIWKGMAFGAVAGPLAADALYVIGKLWGGAMPLWIAVPAAVGGALGFLAASFIPPVKRWLAGGDLLDLRTRQHAQRAFLEQEVFRTGERTGILVFVSLFERRVVVLGDTGIHQRVEQHHWDGLVHTVVAGIRAGKPGEALALAIRQCGELLERFGVARRADDRNELGDELRRGDA